MDAIENDSHFCAQVVRGKVLCLAHDINACMPCKAETRVESATHAAHDKYLLGASRDMQLIRFNDHSDGCLRNFVPKIVLAN